MFDPLFSILFFVIIVGVLFWYTSSKRDKPPVPTAPPKEYKHTSDEEHLPKWVADTRREMEKRR